MDTIDLLRRKIERIELRLPSTGILAVLGHIQNAERHFVRGRDTGDKDLFSDVVYRTNHAFEGILKEAYAILEGRDPSKIRPFDIETYLSENQVFQPRVLDLFSHYRKQWRNPSTHDHVAAFTESEAFLALLSVTAFVGILMDQMLEKLALEQEGKKARHVAPSLRTLYRGHKDEHLIDRAVFLLEFFGRLAPATHALSERELLAAIRAHFEAVAPEIRVLQQPLLTNSGESRQADLVLRDGEHEVIVEVKRFSAWDPGRHRMAVDQARELMDASGAEGGVVFALPTRDAVSEPASGDRAISQPLENGRAIVTVWVAPRGGGTA